MSHEARQFPPWLIFDVSQDMSTESHLVIDVVAHDPGTDSALLAMTEARSWIEGTDKLLFDIHEKLNTYIGYVVEGRLAQDYPRLRGKRVEFRLICKDRPPDDAIETMRVWKEEVLTPRSITWSVTLLPSE